MVEAGRTPGPDAAAAAVGDGGGGGEVGMSGVLREGDCPTAAADPGCSPQHTAKSPPCSSFSSWRPGGRVVEGWRTLAIPGRGGERY